MFYKQVVKDTAKVLQSYLTYQAVRIIIQQLSETNPGQSIWLSQYSDRQKVQDSDSYLEQLIKENKELALRVLTVRQDLAEQVLEFLPEMVSTNINQSNMEHRRRLLELLTQTESSSLISSAKDETNIEPQSNQSENKQE
jgi:O-methyltransferase involved in polyketide biosynthesis